MRVIVANLDAELEMARDVGGTHPRMPSHVRGLLAERATRLAALDPRARVLTSVAGVVDEELVASLAPTELIAWAETRSVRALRRRYGLAGDAIAEVDVDVTGGGTWLDALWRCAPDPDVVTRCHDRRFWLALATSAGGLLPETHLVATLAELRARLPAVTSRSFERAWVAKAPFGASGRERVYRWGTDFPEDIEIRLERLLERYGQLILEPLMKRTADIGVGGVVGSRGALQFAPHRLRIDDAGVFRTVELAPPPGWISPAHLDSIRSAAAAAGDALAGAGYLGAFGIDAFVYRDSKDRERLHPMCEINARLTFGHVALARAQGRQAQAIE